MNRRNNRKRIYEDKLEYTNITVTMREVSERKIIAENSDT
jgi:hypothetical protein